MRKLLVFLVVLTFPVCCFAEKKTVVFEETFQSTGRWATDHGGIVETKDNKGVFGGGADKEGVIFAASRVRVDLDEGLVFKVNVSAVDSGAEWRIMMGAGDGWWSAPNFHVDTWKPSRQPERKTVDITALAAGVGLTGLQDLWIVFWVRNGNITVDSISIISLDPKPTLPQDPRVVFEQDFVSPIGVSVYGDGVQYDIVDHQGMMRNPKEEEGYVVIGPVYVNLDEDLMLEFRVSNLEPGTLWNLNVGYKDQWWQGPHARPYGTDMIYTARDVLVSLTDIAKEQVGLSSEQNLYFTFDIRKGGMVLEYFRIRRK